MVGLKCKDGVVFGVEKLTQSKLHKSTANSRVFTVDDHVGMVRMMSLPTWVLSCMGLLCLSIPDVSPGPYGANRLFQFHFVKVLCSFGPYLLPLLHCLHSTNRCIFFFCLWYGKWNPAMWKLVIARSTRKQFGVSLFILFFCPLYVCGLSLTTIAMNSVFSVLFLLMCLFRSLEDF